MQNSRIAVRAGSDLISKQMVVTSRIKTHGDTSVRVKILHLRFARAARTIIQSAVKLQSSLKNIITFIGTVRESNMFLSDTHLEIRSTKTSRRINEKAKFSYFDFPLGKNERIENYKRTESFQNKWFLHLDLTTHLWRLTRMQST